MLKKRIIANVVVKDGIVVQSINFNKYLPVGKPEIAIDFFNRWGVDEIIYTDISASVNGNIPDCELVKRMSAKCFVPLTVGGGISDIPHIRELMHCGADKISLNSAAFRNPKLVTAAAHIFGNQCIVISIDAVLVNGKYFVYDYQSKSPTDLSPEKFAGFMEEKGAGEILINSVDRDGSYLGFDHQLINSVCNAVDIPVICCGGAKNAGDFIEVFKHTGVSAAAAANFFHFSEHSIIKTKASIIPHIPLRLDTQATYSEANFDQDYRLLKKPDNVLEDMLFTKIEKEII
jgi:cyclase